MIGSSINDPDDAGRNRRHDLGQEDDDPEHMGGSAATIQQDGERERNRVLKNENENEEPERVAGRLPELVGMRDIAEILFPDDRTERAAAAPVIETQVKRADGRPDEENRIREQPWENEPEIGHIGKAPAALRPPSIVCRHASCSIKS